MQALRKTNADVAAASKELSQMEIEHTTQQKATAAARRPKAGVRPPPVPHSSNIVLSHSPSLKGKRWWMFCVIERKLSVLITSSSAGASSTANRMSFISIYF